jgi:pimeloyl-ACP methyl ester carboxylesterase
MGGFIAQTLAMDFPQRVGRLILVSTAMHQRSIRVDERPWERDVAKVEAKLALYFTRKFAERNAMLVKSMAKQIAKAVEDGRFGENSELQKRAVAGFDSAIRIARGEILAGTLVIHGGEDEIIPASAARETQRALLAGGTRDATLELFPGAGHLLLAERPKELYQTVARWFA